MTGDASEPETELGTATSDKSEWGEEAFPSFEEAAFGPLQPGRGGRFPITVDSSAISLSSLESETETGDSVTTSANETLSSSYSMI